MQTHFENTAQPIQYYSTNVANISRNQSQSYLDTMRRLITGALVCEVTFALFHALWIFLMTWWFLFCHVGTTIGYSGQSGVCALDDSQYCDRDNDCQTGDKCNYIDDCGEDEHRDHHCGDLRSYHLALYVNSAFIIIQIINYRKN